MAAKRKGGAKSSSGRDGYQFAALPWPVLKAPAYLQLSKTAKALLVEVAFQFTGHNNGRLLISMAHLRKRNWNSADVVQRAKQELLNANLIFETVKGHRPNKASWYALTWQDLDRHPDYDPGASQAFSRGAYRVSTGPPTKSSRKGYVDSPVKNERLSPANGATAA
jgi:hypothetical protein